MHAVEVLMTKMTLYTFLLSKALLPNIVRVVKSRRMRWAGHVAGMGEGRGVHRVLVGKLRERDHWETQT